MRVKSLLIFMPVLALLIGCGNSAPAGDNKLIAIEIHNEPDKTEYVVGEKLDPTGLVIKAIGSLESELIQYLGHESDFSFAPLLTEALSKSINNVYVTYKEKVASYPIKVTESATTTKYTVDFSAYDLGTESMIQSSDPLFNSKIKDFVNLNANDHLKEFTSTGDNKVRLKKDTFYKYEPVQALILASQKGDGSINLTFDQSLVSVTLKVQQYYSITPGYDSDDHLYPTYDSTEPYTGYVDFEINDNVYQFPAIDYEYDEEGYPTVEIPLIYEVKCEECTSLLITAHAANRIRIHQMIFEFAE